MKLTVALFLFACLLAVNVEGQARNGVSRCVCRDAGVMHVQRTRVEKIEVLPPSASCDKQEIIVHLKNGAGKRCLNPKSNFVKNFLEKFIKK
ncbi:C-X-C motif chemokine 11-6-like [Chanos chanos]|uniref:C-X-C motif chemokine 11-6-like n=1 Tax=Chanos chanos TaxID=29144 RepID=A0A6J2WAL7_CHACN|nr:C-X-C motif chemokine 11-6-like [Chanos chanos]